MFIQWKSKGRRLAIADKITGKAGAKEKIDKEVR